MSVALLDVSALLALLLENHEFHGKMTQWFATNQSRGWATCPITQSGFVRIASNPAYVKPAPGVRSALNLLEKTTEASRSHEFWPDDLPLFAFSPSVRQRLQGPRQITDAYLLALSLRHGGKLVTFDRRTRDIAPQGSAECNSLHVLG